MASLTPPNGSRGRPRLTRSDWSMAHMMSERTIDTSSMTRNLRRRMTRPLRLRRMSSGRIRRGGKPKKEWMVWPPTLTAARPVGATITISSATRSRRHLSSVDLPVPARPVTNRWPAPSRRNSWAARNSDVGSTPAGQLPGAAGRSGDGGRRGHVANPVGGHEALYVSGRTEAMAAVIPEFRGQRNIRDPGSQCSGCARHLGPGCSLRELRDDSYSPRPPEMSSSRPVQ